MSAPHLFPDTPTGGTPPTPPTSPTPDKGANPDQITLSRADYDKLQAEAREAASAKALKMNWDNTVRLLKADPERDDRGELIKATQHVLKEAGYTPDEIQEYVNRNYPDPTKPPTPKGRGTPAKPRQEPPDDPEGEEDPDPMDKIREDLDGLRTAGERERLARLNREFAGAVDSVLDIKGELGTMIDDLVKANTDGQKPEEVSAYQKQLIEQFREDVDRQTRVNLNARREASRGQWQDSWIQEEARKAGAAILARSRRLVPNVGRLLKAPAGDSIEQYMAENKPLEAPRYKAGMKVGDVQKNLRDWGLDRLLRTGASDGKNSV